MIKIDKIRKNQNVFFYILDYLWGGLAGLGVAFVLIAVWQETALHLGALLLPAPLEVFTKAGELLSQFTASEIHLTLYRALIGISISLILGILAGFIAGKFKTAMALLRPMITILLAMPPIIWIVLAIFWFSFGNPSVIFTIIAILTPLTFANAAIGMASVNDSHLELFDAYQLGLYKKIRFVYLPHLSGYLLSAISLAVGSGIKVVFMAELLGANDGVGAKIATARTMLDSTEVLAYVVLAIAFVSLFEYLIIKPLEIAFMPWKR
ncbi:MAG: ABC transporter permease subunit [Neisseriaceae bacterium]|nr:ABC transporter permease subunit [Neisseriaceae bacterium]